MDRLAGYAATSLRAQVEAGAQAVQLFDSWAGALSPSDYRRFVLPASRRVFEEVAALGVPGIHFGVDTSTLLELMAEAGADVIGVDWRVPLDQARHRLGRRHAVQGNLDPALCLAPWPVVQAEARRVMADAGSEPGHIFNLGHGVLPETEPDILRRLVELVHDEG
jgi:uroporphyrinogen decarboxylase